MPKEPPPEVQDYIAKLPSEPRKTVADLRNAILRANPALAETLNPWGYLTFGTLSVMHAFTLVPHEKHVNFQIFNGAQLVGQLRGLEGTGKSLRHVKFPYGQPVDRALVARAIRLSLAA